jgi:Protein of unknown function (DUF1566)
MLRTAGGRTRLHRNPLAWLTALTAVLAAGSAPASAAPTAAQLVRQCQIAKVTAAATRARCVSLAQGSKLLRLASDPSKCEAAFDTAISAANQKAKTSGLDDVTIGGACRYIDNGDHAVSDLNTLLQWEQKSFGDVSSRNLTWTWAQGLGLPDGTAFTVLLGEFDRKFDFSKSADGHVVVNAGPDGISCLGSHCDWRLPEIDELLSIVDTSRPGCMGGVIPCINPVFGPTEIAFYWSNTTHASFGIRFAWEVSFGNGLAFGDDKRLPRFVRLVRGGRRLAL